MGRHPSGERKYEIEHIWDVHREILRRLVLGQSRKQIAEDLGITPQTVTNVANSQVAQRELERLRNERDEQVKDVKKIIERASVKAALVLEEVIEDPGARGSDRVRAAIDILDRAGHGAVKKVAQMHLTPEDIERIRERGIELAREVVVEK